MKLINLIIFCSILFASCTQTQFVDPQPESLDALNEIPKNFQGTFYRVTWKDTITYLVTDSSIVQNEKEAFTIGSNMIVKGHGNTLYINTQKEYGFECRRISLVGALGYEKIIVKAADIPLIPSVVNVDELENDVDPIKGIEFFRNIEYSIIDEEGNEISSLNDGGLLLIKRNNMNHLHSFFNHQQAYKLTRIK